jgi:acetyl-CoA carboxylase biotin carboxyl carrier protein
MADPIVEPSGLPTPDPWLQVARWMQEADIDSLALATPTQVLRLTRGDEGYDLAQSSPAAPAEPARQPTVVPALAPCAGVFLDQHPDGPEFFARPGQPVVAGEIMALLKIGLLLVPVVAPADGIRGQALQAAGAVVGYGTPLMDIRVEER